MTVGIPAEPRRRFTVTQILNRLTFRHLLFGMCLILVFGTLAQNSLWNASVRSRLATVQSLVERGTFRIDESEFSDTIDKVYVNGHFYSDKPPLLAVLGAAPYYVLRTFAGRRGALGKSADALITLSTMGIGFVLGIICFYDGLKRIGIPREYRLIMTASLGLATIYGVWNLTFNNNGFAASWLFIGFYCLLRARQTGHRNLWLFLSGLSLSMAGAVDNPTTLFFVAFAVYVLAIRELRSGFLFYALPVLITFLPSGLINYAISGSIRPVQLNPEYFRYPGSYWLTGREALSGVKYNSPGFALRYGFYCLFGPQGFLLYNPLQLIALWYLVRGIASRGLLWMEGAIVLGVFSSTAFYYFISTTNYGGYSYSIRWLVPAIPLLWFFAFGFFENFTRAKRMVFTGLFAMSMVIAAVGAGNPWAKTENGRAGFLVNVESIGSRIHQFEAKWRAHS